MFPTIVTMDYLEDDILSELLSAYAITGSKDWEACMSQSTIHHLESIFSGWVGGKSVIVDGWIRTLGTSGHNDFELHCDNHYGNQYVAVIQLKGEEGVGGDLVLYDPAWRNPQFMSDGIKPNTFNYTIPFSVGRIVMFPSNVWHRVTEYVGTQSRSTLNLMIRRVE